jgi:hypothetical protein
VAGSCGHANDPSGSVDDGQFLNKLIDYHLRKKSAPWS